jgi:hypothetical protein
MYNLMFMMPEGEPPCIIYGVYLFESRHNQIYFEFHRLADVERNLDELKRLTLKVGNEIDCYLVDFRPVQIERVL